MSGLQNGEDIVKATCFAISSLLETQRRESALLIEVMKGFDLKDKGVQKEISAFLRLKRQGVFRVCHTKDESL